MNKSLCKVLICSIAITSVLSGLFVVSAKKYQSNVLNETFNSSENCVFMAPGDMNADGVVNAADEIQLRNILLKNDTSECSYLSTYTSQGADAKYSDINGDDTVSIVDLVRMKNIKVVGDDFVKSGAIHLNGNSAFSESFRSTVIDTGASYKLTYSYVSEQPIKVKLRGMGETITFSDDASANLKTVSHTFKAPVSFDNYSGVDLQIIGVATVEAFSVTRINTDNELSDSSFS